MLCSTVTITCTSVLRGRTRMVKLDDERGIRQFIVGTGRRSLYPFGDEPAPNSEVRTNETYGLLKLALHEDRYDWEFVTPLGAAFSDSGSSNCH